MSNDENIVALLQDIRNCLRAVSFPNLKVVLLSALPDEQTRKAYQMLDGKASIEQVRVACKMSPNKLVALTQKWSALGLMESLADKKRRRLFDLRDFEMHADEEE